MVGSGSSRSGAHPCRRKRVSPQASIVARLSARPGAVWAARRSLTAIHPESHKQSIRSGVAKWFAAVALLGQAPCNASETLGYEAMVILDAEDLAEQGMAAAYAELLPRLRSYVRNPLPVEEIIDSDAQSYAVRVGGVIYMIYSPEVLGSEEESWGRATYFFFQVVNLQLKSSPVRFYAINGGNDLGGLFLSEEQAKAAMRTLPRKTDWPYIPTLDPPWYGQQHSQPLPKADV